MSEESSLMRLSPKAKGERITTFALFGLQESDSVDWATYVLQVTARQNEDDDDDDGSSEGGSSMMEVINAFCGELDDVLLCAVVRQPHLVRLLLEYGADTEVTSYDYATPLEGAKALLRDTKDPSVRAKLQETCRLLVAHQRKTR